MIVGLQFHNFSLLQDFSLGLNKKDLLANKGQTVPPLGSLVALIGPNSTGKSTIFEGLAFLRDILRYGVAHAAALEDRGGFARLRSDFASSPQAPISFELLLAGPGQGEQDDREGELVRLSASSGASEASEASAVGNGKEQTGYLPGIAENYYAYQLEIKSDRHQRPYLAGESASRLTLGPDGWQEQIILQQEGHYLKLLTPDGQSQTQHMYETKTPGLAFWGLDRAYPDLHFILQKLRGIFVYRLNTERPRQIPEQGGHKHLKERRDNLQNVLNYMEANDPQDYSAWLEESLARIPQYTDKHKEFSLAEMSTGELKLFELLVLLKDHFPLICLDEPDISLYYPMMEALMKEMRDYSLRNPDSQIFYTTHNAGLLQALRPEEVWILDRAEQDGAYARSVAYDPVVQAMYQQGLDMGMLWYGGYLDQAE